MVAGQNEKTQGVPVPQLTNGEASVHFEEAGAPKATKPTLLLLAGIASDHASWGPLLPLLTDHYHIVMPDNRGAGQTRCHASHVTLEAMAEDAVAVLDHLEITEAHVLGHSMGGMIAMDLASRFPARVDNLVLAATTPKATPHAAALMRDLATLRTAGAPEETWFRLLFQFLFRTSFFDNPEGVSEAARLSVDYPHTPDAAQFASQVAALERQNLLDIGLIKAPTLFLAGEEDILFPPDQTLPAFAGIDHRATRIIKGAAHSIHWDQPSEVAKSVLAFLGT
jgi:pimeloyl-ACP methyl ester carboxylesterase